MASSDCEDEVNKLINGKAKVEEADTDDASSRCRCKGKCKLEYLSDSDRNDEDEDFDDVDSDSSCEPDFLFRAGDDDSSDSDNDENDANAPSTSKEKQGSNSESAKWRVCGDKKGLSTQRNISFNPPRKGINVDLVPPNSTPLKCLHALLTDSMIEEMVTLLNERGQYKWGESTREGDDGNNDGNEFESESDDEEGKCEDTGPWEDVTLGELYKYLLVLISMSIHKKSTINFDCIWGKNYVYGGDWFNKMIPKGRFFRIDKLIREVFDFSDVDPKSEVRGMVRKLMKNSQTAFYPGKRLIVEEMVVGTPNRGWTHIDYDTGTPDNHRVKTLGVIDNESSYIVDLFLCYGPAKKCYNPAKLDDDFTKKILDQLLSSCFEGHILSLDKHYSNLPILNHLEQKFYYIGHIDEKKHQDIPPEVKRNEKLEVGEMKWYMEEDDRNLIAKYRDTKYKLTSALISNYGEVETKFSQGMTMPAMFHEYNLYIKGGERVHEAMTEFGHFQGPEKHWERKFFQWLFEIIQLNAFVLYKQSQPSDVKVASLYKFKRILASEMCCYAGKLYNEDSDAKKVDGCLCYRFEIPDRPKGNNDDDEEN